METKDSMQEKLIARMEGDSEFRARLLTDPNAALKEAFDIDLPGDFNVEVHEDDARTAHLVLPASAELTDTQLEKAAGGEAVCFFHGAWK